MEELVVWLLAAYGCSSLLVMLADRWFRGVGSGVDLAPDHYRLLVRDSEQVLERVIRRLLFRSYWSGKPVQISLIDDGSSDDTLRMAALFERYPYCWIEGQEQATQTVITIDLRKPIEEGA